MLLCFQRYVHLYIVCKYSSLWMEKVGDSYSQSPVMQTKTYDQVQIHQAKFMASDLCLMDLILLLFVFYFPTPSYLYL